MFKYFSDGFGQGFFSVLYVGFEFDKSGCPDNLLKFQTAF
ncbi:hypothetical protein NEILACOT_03645 [Neisseria lactamica ATCC 23970]|uniref:Uncharacterized protein n=1 Tax=Neisseria lactamica ATCC 23970 TaxID=546265 RepID=D0W7Z4_NEILA|nr:hypothetical protein NEILACOT_03645 [Neisseria lactamica ATCC 23970]